MPAQGREGVADLIEQALGAKVARDGEVAAHAGVDAHELVELQDEARGQVVDAEVAHVLEDVERLGAAGARHSRDDHDVWHAGGLLGGAHAGAREVRDALGVLAHLGGVLHAGARLGRTGLGGAVVLVHVRALPFRVAVCIRVYREPKGTGSLGAKGGGARRGPNEPVPFGPNEPVPFGPMKKGAPRRTPRRGGAI